MLLLSFAIATGSPTIIWSINTGSPTIFCDLYLKVYLSVVKWAEMGDDMEALIEAKQFLFIFWLFLLLLLITASFSCWCSNSSHINGFHPLFLKLSLMTSLLKMSFKCHLFYCNITAVHRSTPLLNIIRILCGYSADVGTNN